MDYIKSYKHYFDLYDKEGLNKISGYHFKLILQSLGFGSENKNFNIENDDSVSFNKFSILMTKLARNNTNDDSMKFLFNQYANIEGQIDRDNLQELLKFHLENISEDELANLVEDMMGDKSLINYEKFKEYNLV